MSIHTQKIAIQNFYMAVLPCYDNLIHSQVNKAFSQRNTANSSHRTVLDHLAVGEEEIPDPGIYPQMIDTNVPKSVVRVTIQIARAIVCS